MTTVYGSQAPSNVDAEQSLLGCVLINPDVYAIAAGVVGPTSFYLHKHRWIWDACRDLTAADQPLDVVTISAALDRAHQLEEVGGVAYLTQLILAVPTSEHVMAYAELVRRSAIQRGLIEASMQLAKHAYAGDLEGAGELIADLPLALATGRTGTVETANEVARDVWDIVINPDAQAARLVPSGLAAWDETLGGGPERGTLTVLMARPAMGKTALLVQISDYVSEHLGPVLVLSKEMTNRQWLLRAACRRAAVSLLALKQKQVSEEQRQRVLAEIVTLSERRNLYLDDSGAQTTDQVIAICERMASGPGLVLVIADHLRLFADKGENENKRMGAISWAFKRIAKRFDIPVLAAAQLNRAVENSGDKRPDLKDLRDSGEIEENADTVTALYRDSYYSNNRLDQTAELINRKARDGERNRRATFVYLAEQMNFAPLLVRAAATP